MMKKKTLIIYVLIFQFFFCGLLAVALKPTIASSSTYNYYDLKLSAVDFSNATVVSDGFNSSYWNDDSSYDPSIAVDSSDKVHAVWEDTTNGVWGTDYEIMYAQYTTATGWSNVTVISDGYDGSYWNDGSSYHPVIATDSSDKVHVAWYDYTVGAWGTDAEIMYATYTTATGWSNATVVSDGLNDIYWNDGNSVYPTIAIDNSNAVHVAWHDYTDGAWGTDTEIMYAYFTSDLGWSLPRIISDGFNSTYWNDGSSNDPAIAIDSGDEVHVVWEDTTDGVWGSDYEIMYATYNLATGWSNATVISDGYNGTYWNDDTSYNPVIAVDSNNAVHVAWYDYTDGVWGTDYEIMYANFTNINGWSNITILSDGYNGVYWNDGISRDPAIAISTNQVHVVWEDGTNGVWGTDYEIMYINFEIPVPPVVSGPGGIPFGNFYLLFIAVSIIGLVAYKKRKL